MTIHTRIRESPGHGNGSGRGDAVCNRERCQRIHAYVDRAKYTGGERYQSSPAIRIHSLHIPISRSRPPAKAGSCLRWRSDGKLSPKSEETCTTYTSHSRRVNTTTNRRVRLPAHTFPMAPSLINCRALRTAGKKRVHIPSIRNRF